MVYVPDHGADIGSLCTGDIHHQGKKYNEALRLVVVDIRVLCLRLQVIYIGGGARMSAEHIILCIRSDRAWPDGIDCAPNGRFLFSI